MAASVQLEPGVDESDLPGEIITWLMAVTGTDTIEASRVPGGARHEAWFIDAIHADGAIEEFFLRYNRADPSAAKDPFTLRDEARVFQGLADTVVPVPVIHAVHPELQAVLASRVSGQTWFSRLRDPAARDRVASDFMRILAGLHDIDPTTIELPAGDPTADLGQLVTQEIDRWEAFYRSGPAEPDPLVEFGLRWLRDRIPPASGPVVLVQGDTGPGNFLYDHEGVTAVLDWELAHFGDPHDDLAWLSTRAVQEPFTDFVARLADYETMSGREIDRDRIRYYRVFSELRIVIINHHKIGTVSLTSEVGNSIIYSTLHRRLFVEALADVTRTTLPTLEPIDAPLTPQQWWYDAALAQLSEIIVPRSTDAFVIHRSKGLARIIKFLRDADRLADTVEARELAALASVLGREPAGIRDGRLELAGRIRRGELDESTNLVLRMLGMIVAGETEIRGSAMGALAHRHFDPLGDEAERSAAS